MKTSTVLKTLCLVFAFATASVAVVLPVGDAFAQSKPKDKGGPKVSTKVAKPLQAAMDAVQQKQFDVATTKIAEAKAVEKRTPFDDFNINEIEAFSLERQQKLGEAAAIYEKMLATPEFLKPDHDMLVKKISVYSNQSKDFTKAIEYGNRWLETHPEDVDILEILAYGNNQAKDFNKSRDYAAKAIAINEKAGTAPREFWIQLVQVGSVELKDDAAVTASYEKWARYYPKPQVWDRLLGRLSFNERNDRVMLQWLRLRGDADVLKTADQYSEYADLAIRAALPGEALRVVESGYEKKLLGLEGREKQNQDRLRERVKSGAQADKAQLPQLEKEAQSPNASAGSIAGLGLAYFSYEQYDKAAQNLEAGIKKGGLKNPDDYLLALGISQWKLGQKEQARETFKSVAADSLLAKVANTWVIRTYN